MNKLILLNMWLLWTVIFVAVVSFGQGDQVARECFFILVMKLHVACAVDYACSRLVVSLYV